MGCLRIEARKSAYWKNKEHTEKDGAIANEPCAVSIGLPEPITETALICSLRTQTGQRNLTDCAPSDGRALLAAGQFCYPN